MWSEYSLDSRESWKEKKKKISSEFLPWGNNSSSNDLRPQPLDHLHYLDNL